MVIVQQVPLRIRHKKVIQPRGCLYQERFAKARFEEDFIIRK